MALYSLWALLMWAFYTAPIVTLTSDNLYQLLGNSVLFKLQPIINALIILGFIADMYVFPLVMM
ncbi:MAG: hypothetical protein J1F66_00760 [Clostridiales bacterium]|nr:hypothetical protein [Clostridiales bacterium]